MLEKAWPAWSCFYSWSAFYRNLPWNLWLILRTLILHHFWKEWDLYHTSTRSVSFQSEERAAAGSQMSLSSSVYTSWCPVPLLLAMVHLSLKVRSDFPEPCLFWFSLRFSSSFASWTTAHCFVFNKMFFVILSWDLKLYLIYSEKVPYKCHILIFKKIRVENYHMC